MKCPYCGKWNRASVPVCFSCGKALPADEIVSSPEWKESLHDDRRGNQYYRMDEQGDTDQEPDKRDLLADEMVDLKLRKEEGSRQLREMREDAAKRGSAPSGIPIRTTVIEPLWNIEDNPDISTALHRSSVNTSRTSVHRETGAADFSDDFSWADTRNWDPLWAEAAESYGRSVRRPVRTTEPTVHLSARRKAFRKFIRFFLVLLLVTAAGLGGYAGWNALQENLNKSEESPAVIEAILLDEHAAHRILIPGTDGQQIYITELHTSYVVTDGYATIELADYTWYDDLDDVQDPTMDVSLTPFLKTASGRQQKLPSIQYTIEIPLSPLSLRSPDSVRTEVASSMYTIELELRVGSSVTINGKNVSDTINSETGILSYNATVQPIGDNVFTVRVRSQYCRENSMQIVLYREPQEIPLDLAADTYTSTSLQHMQVNCTTLPGAVVDVLSPYSDLDITNLDTTGEFSFYATFDHIGDNVIQISSSYPGKKTSLIEYTVYYLPSPDIYTRKAWKLSAEGYSELVSNITYRAEHTQVYLVRGKVAYFISEKPQLAVFYTGEDETRPVLVQNYSKTTWVKDGSTTYDIYADAYGTYDGMPWLNGRYTY